MKADVDSHVRLSYPRQRIAASLPGDDGVVVSHPGAVPACGDRNSGEDRVAHAELHRQDRHGGVLKDAALRGMRLHETCTQPAPFRSRPAWAGYPPDGHLQREVAMSAETKTPFDHVNDTVLQLKEMRHYAKNNVELLTTQWLLFDGELSKLKRAEKIEDLMTRQGQFYDALETAITDLEELAVTLQPPPPEE